MADEVVTALPGQVEFEARAYPSENYPDTVLLEARCYPLTNELAKRLAAKLGETAHAFLVEEGLIEESLGGLTFDDGRGFVQ